MNGRQKGRHLVRSYFDRKELILMIATPLFAQLASLNRVPSLHIYAFNKKGKEFPAWIFELLTTTKKPVPLEQLRGYVLVWQLKGKVRLEIRFLFHLLVLCTIFPIDRINNFFQFRQVAKSSLDGRQC